MGKNKSLKTSGPVFTQEQHNEIGKVMLGQITKLDFRNYNLLVMLFALEYLAESISRYGADVEKFWFMDSRAGSEFVDDLERPTMKRAEELADILGSHLEDQLKKSIESFVDQQAKDKGASSGKAPFGMGEN